MPDGAGRRYVWKDVVLDQRTRTHQLRLHLNSLGIPIIGDDFYPVITDKPVNDFTRPLQLLASAIEFTDPGAPPLRRFRRRM
ncbi:hypothetical protein [Nocardia cyriacigeorgica]|uniref:hypothetical protein n=1 Tax=Nocardia cyriacigeorgica TaxID=135487 RepID=UPI00313E5F5A